MQVLVLVGKCLASTLSVPEEKAELRTSSNLSVKD